VACGDRVVTNCDYHRLPLIRRTRVTLIYMRLEIHVRPSASRTVVSGTHDGALVVQVTSPAEERNETRSALAVIAERFGYPATLSPWSVGRPAVGS
jgi:hypothetical protein